MAGVAVMVRDKYAVWLAPEQREELQHLIRVGNTRPESPPGPGFSSRATTVGRLPKWLKLWMWPWAQCTGSSGLTLHLPQRWPWEAQFDRALARLRALPDGGGNRPPSGQPNVPANSLQSGLRVPLAASSPRYLVLTNICRESQSLPRQLKTHTGPIYPKSRRPSPPCLSSPVLLL